MHDFLWFHLAWPLFWFIIVLLVSVAVMIFVGRALGMLLMAWVIYNLTIWDPWFDEIPTLFWLAFLAGVIGIIWGLVNGGGRWLAMLGAVTALGLAILLANSDILGASPPLDREQPGITGQLRENKDAIDTEREERKDDVFSVRKQNNELEQDNNRLEQSNARLKHRMSELEDRVSVLESHRGGK